MSTNVRGVLMSSPTSSAEIVRAVTDSRIPSNHESVVLHLFTGKSQQTRFAWAELTDEQNRDIGADEELARIISVTVGPTLLVNYSDISGADDYREFESGRQKRFGIGALTAVTTLFPSALIRDGAELFAFVYEKTETANSLLLAKGGTRLVTPEPWTPPKETRARKSLLDREFEALRPLRRVFTIAVYLFGALVVLGILFVLGQFVYESLR